MVQLFASDARDTTRDSQSATLSGFLQPRDSRTTDDLMGQKMTASLCSTLMNIDDCTKQREHDARRESAEHRERKRRLQWKLRISALAMDCNSFKLSRAETERRIVRSLRDPPNRCKPGCCLRESEETNEFRDRSEVLRDGRRLRGEIPQTTGREGDREQNVAMR
jgi:hypothetical protein